MPKITLKAARINKGLTISDVAKFTGMSESTIKSWEAGRTFPKQPMIETLCDLYEIPYDYINFKP